MTTPLIVRFEHELAVDPSLVGGKGANLGLLTRAGFDVPTGFLITTAAYRTFLESARLTPRIEELLRDANPADASDLETRMQSVRDAIGSAPIPDPLAREIDRGYAALGDRAYVAVRSSGTAEDLAGASFAGLHDTYLDVCGDTDLRDAVKRCWASLWSSRAVSYRHTRGYDHFASPIAVVVQRMVESEVSGVMFTGNPMTAATDELVINASWGLGEAIVQGIVTPDEFTVQHGDLRILDRKLGAKNIEITRDATTSRGTVTRDVPAARRTVFCLPDESVRDLAALGRRIQASYEGFPQDVEWALAGGVFYVLQSRPITAVEFSWDAEVTLSVPGPRLRGDEIWSRGWADEGWTGAVTPLMFSWRAHGWCIGQDHAIQTFGYPELDSSVMRMFVYYKGKPFYSAEMDRDLGVLTCPPPFRAASQALSRVPKSWQAAAENLPFDYLRYLRMWTRVQTLTPKEGIFFPEHMAKDWSNNPERDEYFDGVSDGELRRFDDADLEAYVRGQIRNEVHFYFAIWTGVLILFRDEMGLLGHLVARWYDGPNQNLLADILSGTPAQTITQVENKELWNLARRIRRSAALQEAFEAHPGAPFFSAIEGSHEGDAFLQDYRAFVKRHGHRGHADRDIYFTRRAEDPTVDYHFLQSMLSVGDTISPDERDLESNRRREAAVAEALGNIRTKPMGSVKAIVFEKIVEHIHGVIAARDLQRYTIDRSTFSIKRGFKEVARRGLERGLLETWRDHYFLTMDELFDLLGGRANLRLSKAKIASRMKNFDAVDQKQAALPMFIRRGALIEFDEERTEDTPGTYRGRATSPGAVVGRARVVHSPKEISRVKAGDILVANSTDPGWTPVFMVIKGIVLETGGLLAHGVLLAREYGFPAVQVERATQLIPDGALVSVDGNSGLVTLLRDDRSDEPAAA